MKKIISIVMLIALSVIIFPNVRVYATEEIGVKYAVYDGFDLICELTDVEVDDEYVSKDFKLYRIVDVDPVHLVAQAVFARQLERPRVTRSNEPSNIGAVVKNIGLYMTHNDESYVPTDGTESVYGAGGIHDVAKSFKAALEKKGINVVLDETLHIPHNSSAYSRSSVTAKKLLDENDLNAIFDVHRDGASRSFYVTKYNGQEKCHVRMVVGKASSNYKTTLEFATYLMAVGQEMYPWLFSDIYLAKGHYNQGLSTKALLFEMGSHLVEKELVEESLPALADVINTTLFGTVVDNNEGNLTINGNETPTSTTVDQHFKDLEKIKEKTHSLWGTFGLIVVIMSVIAMVIFFGYNFRNNMLRKRKNKK